MPTRGERNNNPGNIDRTSTRWQGQATDQTDPRFIVFSSPEYGIRALAKVLLTYQTRDGCKTIQQIINRWAPPAENNTSAYVTDVAAGCGAQPSAAYDLNEGNNLYKIVRAIIEHENGEVIYTDQQLAVGIAMALKGAKPMASVPQEQAPVSQPVSGAKSSEFRWMAFISAVVAAGTGAHLLTPVEGAAIVSALSALYTAGRQVLKAIHAWGYLKNVKDLPQQGAL